MTTHVIWDLGGTLVDTYPDVDRAMHEVVSRHDKTMLITEIHELTTVSSGHAFDVLSERFDIDRTEFVDAYDALTEKWKTHPAPLADGAREVMDIVRDNGGLNLVVTHRERTSALTLIDNLDIDIDDLICAPDGFERKPSPQMFVDMLNRHDLKASQVIAVGDRPIDAQAADAAGITAYCLSAGCGEPIDSLFDLVDILQG